MATKAARPTTHVNVADEFMASLEEGLSILKGDVQPARAHAVAVPEIHVIEHDPAVVRRALAG